MLYNYKMKLLLWRRKNREDAQGLAPLQLRFTLFGVRAEMETDIRVPAAYWPAKCKQITLPIKKSERLKDWPAERVDELNGELDELKARATAIYKERRLDEGLSAALIRDIVQRGNAPTQTTREPLTIFKLGQQMMEVEQQMDESARKRSSTLGSYASRLKNLKTFLTEGIQKPTLLASVVDKPLCRVFERWCLSNGHGVLSMRKQINFLQMVVSFGVHEGLLQQDTVAGYKYQSKAVAKVPLYLPLTEHLLLQSSLFTNGAVIKAVIGWLFCAATGLSWVDYCAFAKDPNKYTFLEYDDEGNAVEWIRMVRTKMERRKPSGFSVPFFPEAKALLIRCHGKLPYSVGSNANKHLRHAETVLNLSAHLTTKLARSTFSQRKRDEGWSDEAVASMMGDTIGVMNTSYSRISEKRIMLEMQQVGQLPKLRRIDGTNG
jgi:hypothetical protein